MGVFDLLSRVAFGLLSLMLMLLAAGLVVVSVTMLVAVFQDPEGDPGHSLLRAVGYTVVSIAVFEVSKYLFEEEVMNPREMRHASEARRGLTKFISTIAIIVFLEALVATFMVSTQESISMMLYPTLLLVAGVVLVVGLGIYQRLSAQAEREAPEHEEHAAEGKEPFVERKKKPSLSV